MFDGNVWCFDENIILNMLCYCCEIIQETRNKKSLMMMSLIWCFDDALMYMMLWWKWWCFDESLILNVMILWWNKWSKTKQDETRKKQLKAVNLNILTVYRVHYCLASWHICGAVWVLSEWRMIHWWFVPQVEIAIGNLLMRLQMLVQNVCNLYTMFQCYCNELHMEQH